MNAYGIVHAMFHAATAAEKIAFNPCVVNRGDLPMRRARRGRRYEQHESTELASCEALPPDVRVLFCLLSFTAERVGEACGHRWHDWDRDAEPLGALTVERQYDGLPLKTSTDRERPRVVPVHPELAKALDWWWKQGWEAFYGRPPRDTDPIIPNHFKRGHHSVVGCTSERAHVKVIEPRALALLPDELDVPTRRLTRQNRKTAPSVKTLALCSTRPPLTAW